MGHHRREIVPGQPHHVVHRGNNRRVLVSRAFDYWRLLAFIAEAAERWRCLVHALALMSNHLHLLVTPVDEVSLSLFVKSFAGRYAHYRNGRRQATGKLFEERYRRYPLHTDIAVGVATGYIDLNPVRAGMVITAEEHRWTTARAHLGLAPQRDWPAGLWTPSDWYRGLGDTDVARALRYREWLDASPPREPPYSAGLREIEGRSSLHYALRLRRPNGMRAAEPATPYGLVDARSSWARTRGNSVV